MAAASEAEWFFESLARDFGTAFPLRWSFLLGGLPEDRVGPFMEEVKGAGFTEVEPLFDEEREGRYILWFADPGPLRKFIRRAGRDGGADRRPGGACDVEFFGRSTRRVKPLLLSLCR